MTRVLMVSQTVHGTTGEKLGRQGWVWCPGCRAAHAFVLTNDDGTTPPGPVWDWDGNLEQPTFNPSLLYPYSAFYGPPDEDGEQRGARIGEGACHSFVRAGRWEFLTDSGHHLAGQTVDMVPLPDWLVR